ncbi:MvdC/MvdD family ATP grasp protein [Cystobacter fuscus]
MPTVRDTVLLITHSGDYFTVDRVAQEVSRRGLRPLRINTDGFPSQWELSSLLGPAHEDVVLHTEAGEVHGAEVRSVWLRRRVAPRLDETLEPARRELYPGVERGPRGGPRRTDGGGLPLHQSPRRGREGGQQAAATPARPGARARDSTHPGDQRRGTGALVVPRSGRPGGGQDADAAVPVHERRTALRVHDRHRPRAPGGARRLAPQPHGVPGAHRQVARAACRRGG